MKLIGIFFLSLFFLFFHKSEPLNLISAQQQEWIAGRKEGGKGIHYTFKFLANRKIKTLQFSNLYMSDKKFDLTINELLKKRFYRKGDTIVLKYSRLWKPDSIGNMIESTLGVTESKPSKDRIEYQVDGKNFDLQILEITKLPKLNLP